MTNWKVAGRKLFLRSRSAKPQNMNGSVEGNEENPQS